MGTISGVLTSLADSLGYIVKSNIKYRSLTKADLQTLIETNISGHTKMVYILGLQSDNDMKHWMQDVVKPVLNKDGSNLSHVYDNFVRMLSGKAAADERKRPLLSLKEANDDFCKILKEIHKKLDYLMEQDSVNLWNVRMSHIAVMGIIRQSDLVLNFSIYLYAYLTRVASGTASAIPRYRENYMLDKCDRAAVITSNLRDKKGPYNFLKEVDTIRKEQRDVVLGATGDIRGFLRFTNVNNFSVSFLDNILSALSALNIFRAALDAWDNYQFAKYERNKEVKEWLEQHVALLRMDLNDMDKNSAQYQKTLQIIQAYDDKIVDYDKKIIAFEEGE